MSPLTFLFWALAVCLLGGGVWIFTLLRLLRLIELLLNAQRLRPGPVELFGRLVVRGQPLSEVPHAAIIHRLYRALREEDEGGPTELGRRQELLAADCQLHTAAGAAVLTLNETLSGVGAERAETRELTGAELQGEPVAQLVAEVSARPQLQIVKYKLTETVLLDGAPVLILGDAVEAPLSFANGVAAQWKISGPSASPLVIREGTPGQLLGRDAVWLGGLALIGSFCLYHGVRLLQALVLYDRL